MNPPASPALPDKSALLARVKASRSQWNSDFRPPGGAEPAGPGEESVWDYPRPPLVEQGSPTVNVTAQPDHEVAASRDVLWVKETAGAPVPYFPPPDVRTDWLRPNGNISLCEWKGAAVAYDLVIPGHLEIADAAWSYPDPFDDLDEGYAQIAGWFAFYPAKFMCHVGGLDVRPQPGGLYGGWVTDRIKGPIKGAAGTGHW